MKNKTDIICSWISNAVYPLRKFGIVFDKFGTQQWDFQPIFFTIQNPNISPYEMASFVKQYDTSISKSIRFDIED